nr:translation initiation factor eif-2b subunit alpha [Quercus suber]
MASPTFDVVEAYHRVLKEDPDITMPVAAIEALILGLSKTTSSTVSETLHVVRNLTEELKQHIPNSISLSAGTDLCQQYLISNLQKPSAGGDFEQIRANLVQSGREIVQRAKAARNTIGGLGKSFVRDGNVVLTNGGSRVVGAMLRSAAETTKEKGSIRFKVIYVVSPSETSSEESESEANIAALRARGIPVATIPPTAVAYCMNQVTQCFVGAEGVMENGGVVSRLGTYQMGILARNAGKPFYVVAETHKFVRLYPMGQDDLGIQQYIINFKTTDDEGLSESRSVADEGVADMDGASGIGLHKQTQPAEDAVDYTPPHYISGIITESGVLVPSAGEVETAPFPDDQQGRAIWLPAVAAPDHELDVMGHGQHRKSCETDRERIRPAEPDAVMASMRQFRGWGAAQQSTAILSHRRPTDFSAANLNPFYLESGLVSMRDYLSSLLVGKAYSNVDVTSSPSSLIQSLLFTTVRGLA